MVALNQTGKSALKNFLNKQQFIERTRGLHESKEANGPRLSFPSCLYIQEAKTEIARTLLQKETKPSWLQNLAAYDKKKKKISMHKSNCLMLAMRS